MKIEKRFVKKIKLPQRGNVFESPFHKTTFITISKDEYDSMQETIDVLKDKELMCQIRESQKAIKEGRVRKWDEFAKEKGVI